MQPKKRIDGDGTGRARLNEMRAQREHLINRVWRAEEEIERDRKLIDHLNELIAESEDES